MSEKATVTVSLCRRTTGVEVTVTGTADQAVEKFYELCEEFDEFPGYGSKKGSNIQAIRRSYAIRRAKERAAQ
jgi:hypothetical protein